MAPAAVAPSNAAEGEGGGVKGGKERCVQLVRQVMMQNVVGRAWEDCAEKSNGKPQMDGAGVPRFGEHWGMSKAQCVELLHSLHDDPHWDRGTNMYAFVQERVIPRTKGTGMGLALLLNQDNPLAVNQMISHCWAENVEEFLSDVIKTTADGDVLFICAFSIYQCEDGAGPSIAEQIGTNPAETPFGRVLSQVKVLETRASWLSRQRRTLAWLPSALLLLALLLFSSIPIYAARLPQWDGQCHGVLLHIKGKNVNGFTNEVPSSWDRCSHEFEACAKYVAEPCPAYAWPLQAAAFGFVVAAAAAQALQVMTSNTGGMVVVPTRATDIYTRLWCVYEIFFAATQGVHVELAKTLTVCGACTSARAECSNENDRRRIRAEVEAHGGFAHIDGVVRCVRRGARVQMGFEFMRVFLAGAVGQPVVSRLTGSAPSFALGLFLAWMVVCLIGAAMVYRILLPSQGVLTMKQAALCGVCLPLAVSIVGCSIGVVVRDVPSTWVSEFGSGILGGFIAFPISYLVGLHWVYRVVEVQQPWGRSFWQIVHAIFSLTTAGWAVLLLMPVHGAVGLSLGGLLPFYDRIIATLAALSCAMIFGMYVPRLLLTFGVHARAVRGATAQTDCRQIKPKAGERLVFLWQRRLHRAIPFAPLPRGLDPSKPPEELATRGLEGVAWSDWMGRLRHISEEARRDPKMRLWTALHVAGFCCCAVAGLGAIVLSPLCCFCGVSNPVVVRRLNTYQRRLEQWLHDFNGVLAPMGMLVKAQTVKRGETEISYLSFALTPEESAALHEEPIFTAGHCLSHQTWGDCVERGHALEDRGRVV